MRTTENEDIHLIQKTIDGNREAENFLYEKYNKIVTHYIINKYSNYYDIEDDVSEIMVRVFTSLHTYNKAKSKFKTWVITISKNYLIDKWRQYQNCITLSAGNTVDLENYQTLSFATSGEVDLTNTSYSTTVWTTDTSCFENSNVVTYLSSQMAGDDFQMLDMKYVQGYNYNEIGSEFNLTSNTISNRVNYVKSKLKKNHKEDVII